MFEYLDGKVSYKKADYVALDVNGIGYKIYISLNTFEKVKILEKYKFFISTIMKEDGIKLIGFLDEKERKLFDLLLSVKGIGLSLGLAILSTFSYEKIIDLIRNEDYKSFKKVPKLGEKKAQLIILDLKTKMKKLNVENYESYNESVLDIEDDLKLALKSLGYSQKDIDTIINKTNISKYENLEEAIKDILKNIRNI